MGYYSDIRIRLKKEDYKTLVEKFEEERAKCELERAKCKALLDKETDSDKRRRIEQEMYYVGCMSDLFDQDKTYIDYNGETCEKTYKDLSIYREEKTTIYNFNEETHHYDKEQVDTVYFGWNCLKWYDGYKDVDFVMDFIENLDYYAYARIGEELGDTEQRENGFDCIGLYSGFNDDEQ